MNINIRAISVCITILYSHPYFLGLVMCSVLIFRFKFTILNLEIHFVLSLTSLFCINSNFTCTNYIHFQATFIIPTSIYNMYLYRKWDLFVG